MIVDLQNCKVGMSCKEYSLLSAAGLDNSGLPPSVSVRMSQHYEACGYHRSSAFNQSMVNTPVTEALEQAGKEVIKKYSQ